MSVFVSIPNGIGYQVINVHNAAHRAMLDVSPVVTVTVYGADKAEILREGAEKLNRFGYAFRNAHGQAWTVEASEITASQEFSVTIRNLRPGTGYMLAIIMERLTGRQQGIKTADQMTVYRTHSQVIRQFDRQFCPSTLSYGSATANGTEAGKMAHPAYVELFVSLYTAYGLYAHGAIPTEYLPA